MEETHELIEPLIEVRDSKSINLDQRTTRALYSLTWERLEHDLAEANAAYNDTHAEPYDRATRLLWALRDAAQYADIIYTLTPIPDEILDDAPA